MKVLQIIFFHNYLLMLPVLGWVAAQVIKAILYVVMNRELSVERLVGSGGMPSSHSAMVCALLVGTIQKYGVSSPLFAVVFVLAVIVMYDAMGVRRETGKQAEILNRIISEMREDGLHLSEKALKEMVGHTPLQVMAGAVLGVLLGLLMPVF